MKSKNLVEVAYLGDTQSVHRMRVGVTYDMLTDEEKEIFLKSEIYLEKKNAETYRRLLQNAQEDFERLRDIKGMPEEAISILKKWSPREGDYDDDCEADWEDG